ncbi:Ff.00g072840.m01.CDS01 [Fusarium sp. VM40]|nr:Ff.00g072840.m01.CDS01 [Fusarium sp. VM40]
MKIESILNQLNEVEPETRNSPESIQQHNMHGERRGSSFSLSTPSPDFAQSRTPSVRSDSRTRTPWDAGGYSLPRDAGPTTASRSSFSVVSWGEQQESARRQNVSNYHSRQVSVDRLAKMNLQGAGTPYTLPVRMPSTPEVNQDAWTPKSNYSDSRPSQHIRRSSLWTEYNTSPATGSHRISDSRSSFSSCCSSTFSASHSRISSVSTINGSSTMSAGISDLEAKLERLPRLTAPLPPVVTALPVMPDIRLSETANAGESLSFGSPSDSILEARMMRRKHNHLSEDRTYLKPKDHLLQSLDRAHKRTISAPNPAQSSTQPFLRTPTALPSLASRHFETAALPSPQINPVYNRPDLEQYPWADRGESSPVPSMATKSPLEPQKSAKVLPDRSLQANTVSQASSNDRVVTACRRFRKVDVNAPLEGGDICMAVENCTTGSVPRKVISHLFGRNKVCTRRIPERVWVCMCRKHYQRIRYRTGADFSLTQIGMVYEQIVRMIFWSRGLENPNRTNQEGIAIRSWTFSIRRREVKRLADANGRDLVPRWIMQSLGEGKTHDEILDVVERLHQEIQQGVLKEVPPVEFLPEVVDAFTNAPPQLQTHFSSGGETSFTGQSSRSLNPGESTESPASFVKDSSPLEPVQEEGSMSDRNSEQSASSPTPPAAYNGHRPVHHSQSLNIDAPNRTTTYASGAPSPLVESVIRPGIDRRHSLAYQYSQNPLPPPISYSSINRQMQAPVTDHRGSYDNSRHSREAYSGDYHYGPSEFVLTGRNSSIPAAAMPMMDGEDRTSRMVGYVGQGSRDSRNDYAMPINPQITSAYPHYPPYGSGPLQGQTGGYSWQDATERHSQFRLSGADVSISPSMPDERSCPDIPHPQSHEPYWYAAETGSNTRIGRSVNQYQQHTLAFAGETSLHSSRQYPREENSESCGAGLGPGEVIPTTYSASMYDPRYQHGYAPTGLFGGNHTRGNHQEFQYNHATSDGDEDWHGTRASGKNNHQGDRFSD